jgi:hypothetical protein
MNALKTLNRSVKRSEQADDVLHVIVLAQRVPLWEAK